MSYTKHNFQDGQVLTGAAMADIDNAVYDLDGDITEVRGDINGQSADFSALLNTLGGEVRTNFLKNADSSVGKYYDTASVEHNGEDNVSVTPITGSGTSANYRFWEPVSLPAGTYAYRGIAPKYTLVKVGNTVSKALGSSTQGTLGNGAVKTFENDFTLYASATASSPTPSFMRVDDKDDLSADDYVYSALLDQLDARITALEQST